MTRIYTAHGGDASARQLSLLPGAKAERESTANRGMALEHELMTIHALYRRRKLARVEKNFVQCQPVKGGEWARITGKAIVDFTGTLAGGRAVAFDAKDCVGRRIELNRLAEHQIAYLGDVYALGGLAFVLVRFDRKRCYRIPVDAWADAVLYHDYKQMTPRVDGWRPKNAASLTEADMKSAWAVRGVDWLEGVLQYKDGRWAQNGSWQDGGDDRPSGSAGVAVDGPG